MTSSLDSDVAQASEIEGCLWKACLHIPDPATRSLLLLMERMYSLPQGKIDSLELERVWKTLYHMVASDHGREVLKHLGCNGCITNLEITKATGISREAVKYHLSKLEDLGLIKVYTTIENMPKLAAEYRNAKVRGWVGLPPEYAQEAIKRYLTFFVKTESVTDAHEFEVQRAEEQRREDERRQEEEAEGLLAEYMKDRTAPVRLPEFRNWLRSTKGLDFDTAKAYAEKMHTLGSVSP